MPRTSICSKLCSWMSSKSVSNEKPMVEEDTFKEFTQHLMGNDPASGLEFLKNNDSKTILNYTSKTGQTVLHIAIMYANRYSRRDHEGVKNASDEFNELINYLLFTIQIDSNKADGRGITPLMYAGRFLLPYTFETLLHHGCSVFATSPSTKHTIGDMMEAYKDSPAKDKIIELLNNPPQQSLRRRI